MLITNIEKLNRNGNCYFTMFITNSNKTKIIQIKLIFCKINIFFSFDENEEHFSYCCRKLNPNRHTHKQAHKINLQFSMNGFLRKQNTFKIGSFLYSHSPTFF